MDERKLRVRPNPYAALDHKGRPAAKVQYLGLGGVYIGAVLDDEASKKEGKPVFAFDTESIVELPYDVHYVRLLQEGALIPADASTAKLAGLKGPQNSQALTGDEALSHAADKARAAHKAQHGEPPKGHERWGKTMTDVPGTTESMPGEPGPAEQLAPKSLPPVMSKGGTR